MNMKLIAAIGLVFLVACGGTSTSSAPPAPPLPPAPIFQGFVPSFIEANGAHHEVSGDTVTVWTGIDLYMTIRVASTWTNTPTTYQWQFSPDNVTWIPAGNQHVSVEATDPNTLGVVLDGVMAGGGEVVMSDTLYFRESATNAGGTTTSDVLTVVVNYNPNPRT